MENYKIRPYARLLSMLGDQLIKNEIIALTELVKNAYDADASTCLVNFCNMNGNCTARPVPKFLRQERVRTDCKD